MNKRLKIRLDFAGFWPGFSKTENFFYPLLSERFDVQLCDQPDFLIFSDLENHQHRIHNCVKIFFTPESFAPDFRICDYALTCRYLDDPRHIRLPYYVIAGPPGPLMKQPGEAEEIVAAKSKFCAFVVSNSHPRKTRKRTEFFHQLSRYKKVDSGGSFLNNIGYQIPRGQPPKLDFLRSYKFSIAFENEALPGYTTEKIVESMLARCLPIYWGSPRVGEEFNARSFVNHGDFPSAEALIERIIELDKDDAKYLAAVREPYFIDNKPNEYYDRERLLDFFEKIFTTKITPVSQRRSLFQISRWIPVKKNKLHLDFPR